METPFGLSFRIRFRAASTVSVDPPPLYGLSLISMCIGTKTLSELLLLVLSSELPVVDCVDGGLL